MASRGQPLLITDMATDWHTQRGVWPQLDATSLIAAPLESQGMVVGMVAVVARTRAGGTRRPSTSFGIKAHLQLWLTMPCAM